MKDEVSEAWTHGNYRGNFTGKLPSSGILGTGIKEVCFGNLTISPAAGYSSNQTYFKDYGARPNHNIFVYPPESACSGKSYSYELKCDDSPCVKIDNFFCVNVVDGKVPVWIEKAPTDRTVTIKP